MDATTIFNKNEASIEIERNSRGYNYKIKAYGETFDEILKKIKEAEEKIKVQLNME